MRIIDKNTDFYDFWQGIYRDDSVVFDRTDSFVLTKNLMCDYLNSSRHYYWKNYLPKHIFLLLQVGSHYWLFLVDITKETDYDFPTEYAIECITSWTDYTKPIALIQLETIDLSRGVSHLISTYSYKAKWIYERNKIYARVDSLVDAIKRYDYKVLRQINKFVVRRDDGVETEKHIPLLKACGIGQCVDSHDIYLAFEEYFLLKKSETERTESKGLTNNEKIENHGFDLKSSFRGKGNNKND